MSWILGVIVLGVVVGLAHQQPGLGMRLGLASDTRAVVAMNTAGPSAAVPVGTPLVAIQGGGDRMDLRPLDLTIEPDGSMGTYEIYGEFLARQDRLAAIQRAEEVEWIAEDGRAYPVRPQPQRPLGSLPTDFWVQLAVGLVAWWVSAAVIAFRPGGNGARYLLLSGFATLLFAPAAAIYTTRELAVPAGIFHSACDLNFFGGSLFAASFVGLLLYYPRPMAPRWVGRSVVGVFVLWFVLQQIGVFSSMTFARRFLVMLAMPATLGLAGWHWFRTSRSPVERAALQWFLGSWLLGTFLFAGFILLPQMFGIDTSPLQGYAFLLFLLVYGGLAVGILRFRLFEIGQWWRQSVGWAAMVLLLVILDGFFVFTLEWSESFSLSAALLVCGGVWLPFRAWVWRRMTRRREAESLGLFREVLDLSALPPGDERRWEGWKHLIQRVFDPLSLDVAVGTSSIEEIGQDGQSLLLPGVGGMPALRLEFLRRGRALFGPAEARQAGELRSMLEHAIQSHTSYQSGVAQERGRISRDLHDHIGAHLLAALQAQEASDKDLRIRESLADLREVINDRGHAGLSLGEALADLRSESGERLEMSGIHLRWKQDLVENVRLSGDAMKALRAVIRESLSNVIRHSGAERVELSLEVSEQFLQLVVEDDGGGWDGVVRKGSTGMAGMRERLEGLKGSFECKGLQNGVRLRASFPMMKEGVLS
ncbi:signal transduction histidine kinase [Haloferula luteola]|uniref:Signal transduction histidine kinase n=1 Tax=Haloferula luteola TaxID=595692 RepID=A0A840VD52_9BACT|nr:hypothetical protein [Haloferula luteola]MBB5350781.1 signal transduction histidine kinase [Haloferula luteola]